MRRSDRDGLTVQVLLTECATSHTSMSRFGYERLKGKTIEFLVEDIHIPDPAAVVMQLHAGEIINGTVVDLSDAGADGGVFVVIDVRGVRQPCVLPVERILRAL
jgi:hypothetical protein